MRLLPGKPLKMDEILKNVIFHGPHMLWNDLNPLPANLIFFARTTHSYIDQAGSLSPWLEAILEFHQLKTYQIDGNLPISNAGNYICTTPSPV